MSRFAHATTRLIASVAMFWFAPGAVAADRIIDDIWVLASAKLSVKVPAFGTNESWDNSVVRKFELICVQGDCTLTVVSVMAENCNGQKLDIKNAGGVGADVYSAGDMDVTPYGTDSIKIKFTDKVWLGPTEETIIIAYKDMLKGSPRKIATKITGTVSGPVAASGEMKSVNYQPITDPIYCAIEFKP